MIKSEKDLYSYDDLEKQSQDNPELLNKEDDETATDIVKSNVIEIPEVTSNDNNDQISFDTDNSEDEDTNIILTEPIQLPQATETPVENNNPVTCSEGQLLEELLKLANGELVIATQYAIAYKVVEGADLGYIQEHLKAHADEEMDHYKTLIDEYMQRSGKVNTNLKSIVDTAIPSTVELPSETDSRSIAEFFNRAEEDAILAYDNFHNKIQNIDSSLADVINTIEDDEREHQLDFAKMLSKYKTYPVREKDNMKRISEEYNTMYDSLIDFVDTNEFGITDDQVLEELDKWLSRDAIKDFINDLVSDYDPEDEELEKELRSLDSLIDAKDIVGGSAYNLLSELDQWLQADTIYDFMEDLKKDFDLDYDDEFNEKENIKMSKAITNKELSRILKEHDIRVVRDEAPIFEASKPDKFTCCLCGKEIENEYGNNPAPLKESGKCCDDCNKNKVIPARLRALRNSK